MKLEFSINRFLKNTQISIFMKICPVGAELFHAGRWTNKTKLITAFCNVANVPKEQKKLGHEVTVTRSYLSYFLNLYIRGPFI
jgi:hypothetical protein